MYPVLPDKSRDRQIPHGKGTLLIEILVVATVVRWCAGEIVFLLFPELKRFPF